LHAVRVGGRLRVCRIAAGVLVADVSFWPVRRNIRRLALWQPCSLFSMRWADRCSFVGAVLPSDMRHGIAYRRVVGQLDLSSLSVIIKGA